MRELSGSQSGFAVICGSARPPRVPVCAVQTKFAQPSPSSMPGSGAKGGRAFLSTVAGGGPVHTADRIGEGRWYDRLDRLVGMSKADLLQVRPVMAGPLIKNDLPNEDGVPNHDRDGTGEVDNHDVLTGSDNQGRLYKADPRVTCSDWTKAEGDANDAPRVGHTWIRQGFGSGGGYGAIYCFAQTP